MQRSFKLHNENGAISAYLTAAPVSSLGTLVCLHGGPGGDHHGNAGIFDEIAQSCGPLGYDVLQFDMFGAGTSDGSPADITLTTQLRDYRAALEFARRQLHRPIHVVGESMGATIAALEWQPDIRTHILLWPAFDLRDTDLRPYLSGSWEQTLRTHGYIEDSGIILGRMFLQEILSCDFSRCFQLPAAPCLLVHGKGDAAVPFEQSLRAVARATGPCVLFAHPTGDHGLQRAEEREFTRRAVTQWLSDEMNRCVQR